MGVNKQLAKLSRVARVFALLIGSFVLDASAADLLLNTVGQGSGTITATPGESCTSPCSGGKYVTVANGTVVTLTATPAAGSYFAGWSGNTGSATACALWGRKPCVFTADGQGGTGTGAIFTTAAPSVTGPTSLAPGNSSAPGSTVSSSTPMTLSWSPVTNAVSYQVTIVDLSASPIYPVYNNSTGGTSIVGAFTPINGRSYKWYVAAIDGNNRWAYSGEMHFTGEANAAPTPISAGVTTSGSISNLQLIITLTAASRDAGSVSNVYVAALVPNGTIFLFTRNGWTPLNPAAPAPYSSGPLGTHTIIALDGSLDVSALRGTTFAVGYGLDASDMLTNGTFRLVHTIN